MWRPTTRVAQIVKPCRFEVPANAGSQLKQKILGLVSVGGVQAPASNKFVLTHYGANSVTGPLVSDYAAAGDFTLSQVTLPVLDPVDSPSDQEYLGVELTPTSGANVQPVQAAPMPGPAILPAPWPFEVGTTVSCPSVPGGPPPVAVNPPAVQIAGFTTTTPKSLTISVDAGSGNVTTGPVRISQSDTSEISTARNWLAKPQPRTLTVSMAAYNCTTATYSNRFKMSFPVLATSMDPFPRTDRYFTIGLRSAIAPPGILPSVSWQ